MTEFFIINKYKGNSDDGKKISFIHELSNEINKLYGTEKTKFFIKYKT